MSTSHEIEVRPVLTTDLRDFWWDQLAQLAAHQRPAILGLLTQRYGEVAIRPLRWAGCP